MAEKFYTLLTKIGKAKIANSAGFGSKVNFVKMKVGDGGGAYYNPTEEQEDLVNTVWEGNITHVSIDENNPNWINVEMMIPANVGGFMIREYGVFDENNNMLAIAKCAESYKPLAEDGSTKELLMKMVLTVSNTENITLKIDPTIIFAKKSDLEILENQIKNIKIPVKTVNNKTGDEKGNVDLKAADIKASDGKTLEAFKSETTLQLKEKANAKVITGGDFNNIKTPGLYTMNNCATNSPEGNYNSLLVMNSTSESYGQQIAINETSGRIYTRKLNNTTWTTWKELLTVDNLKTHTDKVEIHRRITFGTTEPTGGNDGDIYFQYE